jgi:hypothetical protein
MEIEKEARNLTYNLPFPIHHAANEIIAIPKASAAHKGACLPAPVTRTAIHVIIF